MSDCIAIADDEDSVSEPNEKACWQHEQLAQVKIRVIKAHNSSVNSCEYIDDDQRILTASDDRTVRLFSVDDGLCQHTYKTKHTDVITEARGSPNGSRFVSGSYDKSLQYYDIDTGSLLWRGQHSGIITTCKISNNGRMVASGSDLDNCLNMWDASSGQIIHSIPDLHSSTITNVMFAPDDDKLITTSMDKTTKFFDLRTKKVTIQLEGHVNIVSSCDITRDERKFVTGSWDKNLCIWDIATGTYRSKGPAKLCAGHEGSISCCKFSKDGFILASGANDNTVVVWDVENEIQKIKLQGHTGWIQDVCFSQDDSWIISCGKDGTVRLWNIEDSDKIPIVMEKRRAIGLKMAKCESCGKPFSMAQVEDQQDLTKCVFCRVHTSDLYLENAAKYYTDDPEA